MNKQHLMVLVHLMFARGNAGFDSYVQACKSYITEGGLICIYVKQASVIV